MNGSKHWEPDVSALLLRLAKRLEEVWVPGEEDRWSDIWACYVHGIDIKEVKGHLT